MKISQTLTVKSVHISKDYRPNRFSRFYFYLPHMEYEASIGLVTRKMKKKIADFHFL
jgi:hypothetical protein